MVMFLIADIKDLFTSYPEMFTGKLRTMVSIPDYPQFSLLDGIPLATFVLTIFWCSAVFPVVY